MMDYRKILYEALGDLNKAIDLWLTDTRPYTSPGRVRKFDLYDGIIVWPFISESRLCFCHSVLICDYMYYLFRDRDLIIDEILDLTEGQPRKILRVLRRIQAATAWCLSRAETRKRVAQEMLQ